VVFKKDSVLWNFLVNYLMSCGNDNDSVNGGF
jgi:hypothetical protein